MTSDLEKECSKCKHLVFSDEDWYGNIYYECELSQDKYDCTEFKEEE